MAALGWRRLHRFPLVHSPFQFRKSTTPSQTLDFAQFSPSLGTLNEVDILLTGSTIGGGATANLTGGEGGIAQSSFTATLDVVGPGATNALSGAVSASATCQNNFTFPFTCSSGLVPPTLGVGAFTPNPAMITTSLTPFVGTGTVGLVTEIATFTPTSSCTNAVDATCNNTSDVSWSGSLTVTYLYTPNIAVPEPGGLGVLAAGLVGLGLLDRLRRRS